MPERQEGHLLKKRKWPLKGWHKVGWAGQRAGPDARAGEGGDRDVWEAAGQCWVCVCQEERSTCVVALSPHLFLLATWVLFLLGIVTEILCARGWDPSLRKHSARCESGAGAGGRSLAPKCPGQAGSFWNPPEQGSNPTYTIPRTPFQVSSLSLSPLISEVGSVPSPICSVTVILVRALKTMPGTKVPKKGELYHPCPCFILMLGIKNRISGH